MLTLWLADNDAASFERRKHVGLHHVALQMDSAEESIEVYEVLKTSSFASIEFTPQPLREAPVQHMMCVDPSGLRIELIWTP